MRRLVVTVLAASAGLAGVFAAGGDVAARSGEFDEIVTLGDSYSSGVGIHKDASDYDDHGPERHSFDRDTRLGHSACHRETDTTPGPRLADVLGAESNFVACAGAVIREIPNQVQAADISGTGEGTLVTITIGGNDLRTVRGEPWPDLLLRCVIERNCHESDANQPANLDDIRSQLNEVYRAIGTQYPDLTVRVLGYPRLMQRDRWGCTGLTGMSRHEAKWVDEQVDALNRKIWIAAATARGYTGADIRYVDVEDEFDNHGACRLLQRDRYVNDTIIGETYRRQLDESGDVVDVYTDGWLHLSSSSVHPSQKGYDAYYDALTESIPASAGAGSG
jgi:lysophospholipase L1-like esterase